MANDINGKVWSLDTVAGIVTRDPVFIKKISVTWKIASAGAIVCADNAPDFAPAGKKGMTILDAVTLGAASAGVDQMTQDFLFDMPFNGFEKVTMTNIAKLYVYTK